MEEMSRSKKECWPLKTLDAVLNWSLPSDNNDWGPLVRPLVGRGINTTRAGPQCQHLGGAPYETWQRNEVPKTLYCHDMKGGYLDDRFVNGSGQHDAFRFSRWSGIDTFVYFSHSLVTIPPLGWINAGHTHGVPVLGTIITEGAVGHDIWERLLSNEDSIEMFCNNLVLICVQYNFDGYLLNIENHIGQKEIFKLLSFVRLLKSMLNELKPGSTLLWYDSVILPTGQLQWQNKLNDRNKLFFDACDGIFLNYVWNDNDLIESKYNAGNRPFDVYVGIDVFGRGCLGNGGFNTCVAVEAARKLKLSVALFAPGWVHEKQSPDDPFIARELKFWRLISNYLYLSGPSTLPLSTSFCQGYGLAVYRDGLVISQKPWYNLSRQNYQPTDLTGYEGCDSPPVCLLHSIRDAFEGGGCLIVTSCSNQPQITRLFMCNFKTVNREIIRVETVTKQLDANIDCNLTIVLTLYDQSGNIRMLHLVDKNVMSNSNTVNVLGQGETKKTQEEFVVSLNNDEEVNSWKRRRFQVEISDTTISEIGCYITGGKHLLFGYFGITTLKE